MKKRTLVLTFLAGFAALTFALVFLLRNDEKPQPANEEVLSAEESPDWLFEASYIGPEACGECHTARFNKFRQTAHFKTALLPSETTILGKFTPEKSTLKTGNPNLRFEMQAREDGFYQTAILQTPNGIARRSEKIDFVIGSGKLGQTYLFWREYLLFQLPVSYLTATDEWVNSPGYPDGVADFNRPILPRCMECHSTFFQARSHQNNFYRKERYILGVTCERCHGPGSKHAEYHRQNPDDDEAQFIRFPGDFSRQRLLDLCSQCHAGQGVRLLKPPFSYRPGEDLSRYILLEDLDQQSQSGVHAANQVARLSKSECFQQNDSLTCISCHNPHALERGNLELFSKRCMKCHEPQVCGMSEKLGNKIRENCVDCHMPRVQDLKIDIETTGGFEFPIMPDHLIGIYPEISKRMLKRFSGNSE